jgi:peptidoglycan hydrolase-like protein with peptidoglycan-binding domain
MYTIDMHRQQLFIGSLVVITVATLYAGASYGAGGSNKLLANVFSTFNLSAKNAAAALESANASSTAPAPTLAEVIEELQSHERFLTSQVANLRSKLEVMNLKSTLTRDLQRGDTGSDVSKLQELLASLGVYPSDTASSTIVSGYYGPLTKTAVASFQAQAGLKQSGIFDQTTRNKLYDVMNGLLTSAGAPSAFTDPTTLADLQNIQTMQVQIDTLTANLADAESTISGLSDQVAQLSSDMSDVQDFIDVLKNIPVAPAPTPAPPTVTTPTTPAALAVSNVQAINIAKNSATITWTTNNTSTSEVDYSTNSTLSGGKTITNTTPLTSHSLNLTSLTAFTKYFYKVVSKDSSGTTISSAILSFTTTH